MIRTLLATSAIYLHLISPCKASDECDVSLLAEIGLFDNLIYCAWNATSAQTYTPADLAECLHALPEEGDQYIPWPRPALLLEFTPRPTKCGYECLFPAAALLRSALADNSDLLAECGGEEWGPDSLSAFDDTYDCQHLKGSMVRSVAECMASFINSCSRQDLLELNMDYYGYINATLASVIQADRDPIFNFWSDRWCRQCFDNLVADFSTFINGTGCRDDALGEPCLSNSSVQAVFANLTECVGGYPLLPTDQFNLCSQAEYEMASAFRPVTAFFACNRLFNISDMTEYGHCVSNHTGIYDANSTTEVCSQIYNALAGDVHEFCNYEGMDLETCVDSIGYTGWTGEGWSPLDQFELSSGFQLDTSPVVCTFTDLNAPILVTDPGPPLLYAFGATSAAELRSDLLVYYSGLPVDVGCPSCYEALGVDLYGNGSFDWSPCANNSRSSECTAYIAPALVRFELCTGYPLNITSQHLCSDPEIATIESDNVVSDMLAAYENDSATSADELDSLATDLLSPADGSFKCIPCLSQAVLALGDADEDTLGQCRVTPGACAFTADLVDFNRCSGFDLVIPPAPTTTTTTTSGSGLLSNPVPILVLVAVALVVLP